MGGAAEHEARHGSSLRLGVEHRCRCLLAAGLVRVRVHVERADSARHRFSTRLRLSLLSTSSSSSTPVLAPATPRSCGGIAMRGGIAPAESRAAAAAQRQQSSCSPSEAAASNPKRDGVTVS